MSKKNKVSFFSKLKKICLKVHNSKFFISFRRSFSKFFWVIILIFGIQSITALTPYSIVFGIMSILLAILTNPWFDKVVNKLKISLTKKQKWFIGTSNFLTAAYSVKLTETNYYRCIISFVIMLLFWAITIIYSKKIEMKSNLIIMNRK